MGSNADIEAGSQTKTSGEQEQSLLPRLLCLPVPLGFYDPSKIPAVNYPLCASAHACILSTDPNFNPVLGVLSLLLAAAITVVKILMLASIVIDAMVPRCTVNGHCNAGLWCAPLAVLNLGDREWPEVGRENSACTDCMLAYTYNITNAPEQGIPFVLAGRDYCDGIMDDPNSCDFVRSNRARMSVLTSIILFLLWSLIGKMIYENIKVVHSHLTLFKHRIEQLRPKTTIIHIWALQVASWFGQTIRAFVYPTWMACATINLLVSWAPTTRSVILVPIQIGLISNFDQVIAFLLLGPVEEKYIKEGAKQMELHQIAKTEQVNDDNKMTLNESNKNKIRITEKEVITSAAIRFYSYGLSTTIVVFALHPENIYDSVEFMLAFLNYAPFFTPVAPCEKVYFAGLLLPLILSSIAVVVRTIFTAYHDTSQKQTIVFFFICIFHISMSALFVIYSWVPIASMIYETQFRSL